MIGYKAIPLIWSIFIGQNREALYFLKKHVFSVGIHTFVTFVIILNLSFLPLFTQVSPASISTWHAISREAARAD